MGRWPFDLYILHVTKMYLNASSAMPQTHALFGEFTHYGSEPFQALWIKIYGMKFHTAFVICTNLQLYFTW